MTTLTLNIFIYSFITLIYPLNQILHIPSPKTVETYLFVTALCNNVPGIRWMNKGGGRLNFLMLIHIPLIVSALVMPSSQSKNSLSNLLDNSPGR